MLPIDCLSETLHLLTRLTYTKVQAIRESEQRRQRELSDATSALEMVHTSVCGSTSLLSTTGIAKFSMMVSHPWLFLGRLQCPKCLVDILLIDFSPCLVLVHPFSPRCL